MLVTMLPWFTKASTGGPHFQMLMMALRTEFFGFTFLLVCILNIPFITTYNVNRVMETLFNNPALIFKSKFKQRDNREKKKRAPKHNPEDLNSLRACFSLVFNELNSNIYHSWGRWNRKI